MIDEVFLELTTLSNHKIIVPASKCAFLGSANGGTEVYFDGKVYYCSTKYAHILTTLGATRP
jgi:hypothetical protein